MPILIGVPDAAPPAAGLAEAPLLAAAPALPLAAGLAEAPLLAPATPLAAGFALAAALTLAEVGAPAAVEAGGVDGAALPPQAARAATARSAEGPAKLRRR
jgi:hypothetical protein